MEHWLVVAPRTFTSTLTDPHLRGVEFGRANAAAVARTAQAYADLFARRGRPGFDARGWAARFAEPIADLTPDLYAEILGIAQGAGLDSLEVISLNARTEILAKADPAGDRECSSVLVTTPGHTFGVQTWDWYAAMADNWLHWRQPRSDGGFTEVVTEFGVVGKIGTARSIDGAHVGVLLNILHHRDDDNDDVGLPVHLLSRRLLECRSFAEALDVVRSTPVVASTSLTVFDLDTGGAIELFAGGPGVVAPDDNGLVARTNHFLSSAGAPGCLIGAEGSESTHLRLEQVRRLAGRTGLAPVDVLAAMTHHHDTDVGVCRHPRSDRPAHLRTATLATVVVHPGEALDVRAGGPCGSL